MEGRNISDRSNTRQRILEASLRCFNERGYAATSIAEIATAAGIAKGNLTYYFPTKRDLVVEFARRARAQRHENRSKPRGGHLADEYLAIVHTAMEQARVFRFLMRDRVQFQPSSKTRRPDPEAAAEIELLRELLVRMQKEGMLRQGLGAELSSLARSAWMVSRFWIDHLDHHEGRTDVGWIEIESGMRHHFAILQPCLTASARRDFEAAFVRLAAEQAMDVD